MKKSSRFWWLHGAIVVAAVVGCKSNSSCTSSPYGGAGQGAPPPVAGTPGLTGSASSTMSSQGSTGGYPGMSNMSSGMTGGASGMTGGQSFAPQGGGAMYSGPGLSSGAGTH